MRLSPYLLPSLALALGLAAPPAGAVPRYALAQEGRGAEPPPERLSAEALRKHARTLARSRRFTDAIGAYERLLLLAPGDADATSHLAQLLAWTGNYDKSIVLYRETIARRPRDLGLKSDLADVLVWAKRLDDAEQLYEGVLAVSPEHHEALKGLARVRLLRADAAGAAPILDRALQLYPQDVDLHRDRARMLAQGDDLEGALASLKIAVVLSPTDPDVQRHLGDVLLRKRDWQAALGAWRRVADLDPDSAASHVGLARAYLGLGRVPLAREHLGLALRMNPADAAAHQLSDELERDAGLGPLRSASEIFTLVAHVVLLGLAFLVARKVRPVLRRRPAAHALAFYVVPGFLVLDIASHLAGGLLWRWIDARLFEAVTEVVLFVGLGVSSLALLRREPRVPEFAGQVVLAVGAHPDDIELGAGGFLLKLKASGAKVYGLTMSRGEKGTEELVQREAEARKAAEFLGLDGHWLLHFPDAGLQERIPAMKAAVEAKIQELGATMVLTHTDVDVHGDHRAVHAATREAARQVPTVLCYEDVSTTNQFTPNLYVDIGDYLDDHLRACAIHRTQGRRTYMDPQVIKGRAAHRGMQVGASFALAFRTLNLVR